MKEADEMRTFGGGVAVRVAADAGTGAAAQVATGATAGATLNGGAAASATLSGNAAAGAAAQMATGAVASASDTGPTDANGLSEAQFLAAYDAGSWPRPSVTVDIVLFAFEPASACLAEEQLFVLLIKRGGHPSMGMWALPGGFADEGETVAEAAARELAEETGITNTPLQQLRVFSRPGRDPRTWIISCAHYGITRTGLGRAPAHAGDDAAEARWFKVSANWLDTHAPKDDASLDTAIDTAIPPHINAGRRLQLNLQCDDERLGATVSYDAARDEFVTEQNSGLAFDHAEMIACALMLKAV